MKNYINTLYNNNKSIIDKYKWPRKSQLCSYYKDRNVTLYYIKISLPKEYLIKGGRMSENNLILYKLGLTEKSTNERINSLNFPLFARVTIIGEVRVRGLKGILIEKFIHYNNINNRINFTLVKSGNSEIYYKDILNLDSTTNGSRHFNN